MDENGNLYVAGHSTRTNAPSEFDYVVIKYSAGGVQQWLNRFGGLGSNEMVRAMVVDTSGDVVMTGTGGTVKYHASGLLAWTAPYAGSDLKLDSNGNLYVTGFQTNAYSLVKIAPNGTNIWLRLWDPSHLQEVSQMIAVDSDGSVFVSGLAASSCDRQWCYFQPVTIKYDSSGTLLWSLLLYQGYYNDSQSQYKGAVCDPQGNLYLAMSLKDRGTSLGYPWANRQITSDAGYGWAVELNNHRYLPGLMAMARGDDGALYYTGIAHSGFSPVIDGDYETHKVTGDGTNVWKARYAPTAGIHQANGVVADVSGNAYVTGQSAGVGTGSDYATIKYSPTGQQLWVKRFTEAGNSDDQAHAIAVSPSGDVYVTGFSNPSPGTYEITTIKYIQTPPIEKKTNGAVLLTFCGTPTSNYILQASATLTNWTNLGTTTADATGVYMFEDTNAPAYPQRFYRSVQQ